ncbi:MAG: M20 family peptidase [Spirosomataceae bacterium]
MKKFVRFLLAALVVLVAVLLFNTLRFESKQVAVDETPIPTLPDSALKHFQQSITYKTISFGHDVKPDSVQFVGFRRFLERTYPLVHSRLQREIINYSLLFEWKGKNPHLKPVILMAHQDVVPIEPATQKLWEVDPFGGVVKEGYIWGRGTTDDKINVISLLESTERLLAKGFQPERTVYFVFGHDEEISGLNGALPIAQKMEKQGIKAEFIMDEGGIVTRNKVPGVSQPAALIATAEKGYLSIELSAQIPGGHSSYPAKETALDLITRAIVHLRENPPPQRITPAMQGFFDHIGPEMPFMQKLIFANQWLTKPLLISIFGKTDQGDAMLRTTTAPTIIHSGIKDNVVPTVATATVNFRILPGEDSKQVLAHVKEAINDDRVKITVVGHINEPSKVADVTCFGFQRIAKIAKQNFGGAITTPFLLIGATDSHHFANVSDNILKFSPMIDPIGFHGVNERVSVESYQRALSFYENLLRSLN